MDELRVEAGQITALRLIDVAYAIDLKRAEALWAGRSRRARLAATPPKAVAFGDPPLGLALDPVVLDLGAGPIEFAATARLYAFGAVTLALRVPVVGEGWSGFVDRVNALDRAVGAQGAAQPWQALLDQLRATLGPALERPAAATLEEDYLVGSVQAFDARPTAAELLARVDLVPLLAGEARPLAEGARADLLRARFSYYTDDLVVLTWDRAFIYDPRGESDVADVLEVANAQLLEMRYYDELLDDELPRMYDLVEATRRGVNLLAARRYGNLARRLYTLVAEVTELTERVDNALQVTEDVYLARVYAAALDLFRVPTVTAAVQRKLAIVRDTYTALYDEASGIRAELLEVAIVVLILIELLLAVLRR
jgi:hypothetical protein